MDERGEQEERARVRVRMDEERRVYRERSKEAANILNMWGYSCCGIWAILMIISLLIIGAVVVVALNG